jgi:hypothetical protein
MEEVESRKPNTRLQVEAQSLARRTMTMERPSLKPHGKNKFDELTTEDQPVLDQVLL